MEEIKLGSLCVTKVTKTFKCRKGDVTIPKDTYVTVCDDDDIDKGYVLIESEEYGFAFDYKLDELMLIINSL